MTDKVSPFVIVSTPGMHETADTVRLLLRDMGVDLEHQKVELTTFKNLEVRARIPETVRQQHVFFFHPLLTPTPNEALMNMLITCDALARASVEGITLVVPYMSYLRQDRKDQPRVPITARLVADLIETNKAVKSLVTVDMHAEQVQGFFSIPVDDLSSRQLFAEYCKQTYAAQMANAIVAAPDFGGAKRAHRFAERLGGLPKSIIEKHRSGANVSEVLSVTGESVAERLVLMYDDMIDTGGTIVNAAQALKRSPHNAHEVVVMATHGIFSGNATEMLATSGIPIVTTSSIPRTDEFKAKHPWLTVVPIEGLLADAIYEKMLVGGSVSKLS